MKREGTTTHFPDAIANSKPGGGPEETLPEDSSKEQEEIASETTTPTGEVTSTDGDYDEGYYADVGFLFDDGEQRPTRVETFEWNNIHVQLRVVQGEKPDNLISGHYLWPAAKKLADYLVQQQRQQQQDVDSDAMIQPTSVVELGAGCALLSCVALQLWQPSLECVVVTDQHAGTLERARDNYESTMQSLLDRSVSEEDLNAAINTTASIAFEFCNVPWGDDTAVRRVRGILGQRQSRTTTSSPSSSSTPSSSPAKSYQRRRAEVLLASDVLYDASVVDPLLQTAKDLMAANGVFWLCQSFSLDNADVQAAVTLTAVKMGLSCRTLVDDDTVRIQEFRFMDDQSLDVSNATDSWEEDPASPVKETSAAPQPTTESSTQGQTNEGD